VSPAVMAIRMAKRGNAHLMWAALHPKLQGKSD
jgi:hypothetical protein